MKLFGSFKLTDRIRIGASTGDGSKKSKGLGCGAIFLVLCLICIPISLIKSCVGGDEENTTETTTAASESGIEAFEFSRDKFELDVGETDNSYVRVKGTDDFAIEDVIFVSSDENIVTFEYDETALDTYLYFNVTALSPGTATIHVETADGKVKSEEITVTVLEEETTDETETPTEAEPETTTKKAAETTSKEAETTAKQTNSRTVYRTPSGKRYHYDKECAGKNATETSLDDAKDSGLTPCKTCVE